MKIDIKHKGSKDIQFTWHNAVSASIVGESLLVRRGEESVLVGNYSLEDFDFEINNDD